MNVDNFQLIKNVLKFTSEDDFYFIQILLRKKDGHSVVGNNKKRLIKYYTIKSIEHLCSVENEIKTLCDTLNARAYISPTKRSFKKVANETFRLFAELYSSEEYTKFQSCYSTACGSCNGKDKFWVVDLDGEFDLCEICDFIENECEPINGDCKIQYIVPTVNGKHLITRPFNLQKFALHYKNIDIHKNNPTLLYYKSLV